VVIEKDLHDVAPKDISTTKIDLTMMNGKIISRAPDPPEPLFP